MAAETVAKMAKNYQYIALLHWKLFTRFNSDISSERADRFRKLSENNGLGLKSSIYLIEPIE